MKLHRTPLALALLAALAAAPAAQAEITLDVIGGSEVSFEGLVQSDFYWFNTDTIDYGADSPGDMDGDEYLNELRRAELVLKGKGPGNFEWVMGYDAKDDKFLDANIKYKIGGNSNHFFQVGQFKQPGATMEELSSTKNNDFIAKSSITNSLGTARRVGATYGYGQSNWGVMASYFGRELTRNREHGAGYGIRGYWAPINEAGNVLHLGASYTDKDTDGDFIRLRARPMADMVGTRFVDTASSGLRASPRVSTQGGEGMWITGPFKLQAEYMNADVDRYDGRDDFTGDGYYVSGLWNISGETWGYRGGVPTTPLPDDPAKGLWQLGLRYDTIDLTDGGVTGGELDSWTAGVNWYWRSNFKFMLNYVKVDQEKGPLEDNPDVVEARLQFYW
jgi:phosphate-selective porin OprO/OprP